MAEAQPERRADGRSSFRHTVCDPGHEVGRSRPLLLDRDRIRRARPGGGWAHRRASSRTFRGRDRPRRVRRRLARDVNRREFGQCLTDRWLAFSGALPMLSSTGYSSCACASWTRSAVPRERASSLGQHGNRQDALSRRYAALRPARYNLTTNRSDQKKTQVRKFHPEFGSQSCSDDFTWPQRRSGHCLCRGFRIASRAAAAALGNACVRTMPLENLDAGRDG